MKQIRRSRRFKRDYKKARRQNKNLELLRGVINKIANGKKLDKTLEDHSLSGTWKGYHELHLEPDWLLIYKVTKRELRLARIGSHSELYG